MEFVTIASLPYKIPIKAIRLRNQNLLISDPYTGDSIMLEYSRCCDGYILPEYLIKGETALTPADAANRLNVSVQRISRMCADGLLASATPPARRFILESSLIDYLEKRNKK